MKAKILGSSVLLVVLVLGLGQGGTRLDAASGSGGVFNWIGFLPDLYVSSIVKLDYGSHVMVGFTVRNGGLTTANPFTVTKISPFGSSDIHFDRLGAGQSRQMWLWIPKPTTATPYFLAVDSYFQVGESNEGNNLASFTAP